MQSSLKGSQKKKKKKKQKKGTATVSQKDENKNEKNPLACEKRANEQTDRKNKQKRKRKRNSSTGPPRKRARQRGGHPPSHKDLRELKASDVRPPPYTACTKPCVWPDDAEFTDILESSYAGFLTEARRTFPESFHSDVLSALNTLTAAGYFQFDVVQPGAVEKLAKTYVERCVVGEEGITYAYLNRRIFAFPWKNTGVTDPKIQHAFERIHNLNETMIDRTGRLLDAEAGPSGSCQYNLTLINLMKPEHVESPLVKAAPFDGVGKGVVSWHADTSLQPYSSIAVYHHTDRPQERKWSVGLRVIFDNKTPAVIQPLESGDAYYMLNNFNHHHQHIVFSGDTRRYSSTHRVAVEKDATWSYIKDLSSAALALVKKSKGKMPRPDDLLAIGEAHTEVEMQWIRQFYFQGQRHRKLQTFWRSKIEALETTWRSFEKFVASVIITLQDKKSEYVGARDVMVAVLRDRLQQREAWRKRFEFSTTIELSGDCRPITRPVFDASSPLPEDLSSALAKLSNIQNT